MPTLQPLSALTGEDARALLAVVADTHTFGTLTEAGLTKLWERSDLLPAACAIARDTVGPAGIVIASEGNNTATLHLLAVRPEMRRRGLGRALLQHAVHAARSRGLSEIRTGTIIGRDIAAAAFFQAMGWQSEDTGSLRMRRDLNALPPDVGLGTEVADGYALRTLIEDDAAAFVQLINAAFATEEPPREPWTLETYLRSFRGDRVFAPDRVFLAVRRSDGAVAGTTSSWDYVLDGRTVGLIHWVAVSPEHRGRKLGVALMIRALHDMVSRGHTEAYLHTNATLRHAVQLYESLGFTVVERRVRFHTTLRS